MGDGLGKRVPVAVGEKIGTAVALTCGGVMTVAIVGVMEGVPVRTGTNAGDGGVPLQYRSKKGSIARSQRSA